MEVKVVPLSGVASRLGVSAEIVSELVRRGILPLLEPPGSSEPVVPEYALEQVQARAYGALLRQHAPPSQTDALHVEYAWGEEMQRWLSSHEEVKDLLEAFLRYVAAKTVAHNFRGFKTAMGVRAEGRYCNVVPQARGLLLTVTRAKEAMKYVIRTPADFEGGLRWILALQDPILGGKSGTL